MKLYGKELNQKYRVYDDILTPAEIIAAGLIYVPNFPYIDGGIKIEGCTRKLKTHTFNHNWTDEEKKAAKELIITELKQFNIQFVKKVFLTPFADTMDYSNCCYDVGILVVGRNP